MFSFQNSRINQQEFEKLAELFLKYTLIDATSKLYVENVHLALYFPLNSNAVFKKQRASKVPIHLQDKVSRLLDILKKNETISPVNEEQPKRKKRF